MLRHLKFRKELNIGKHWRYYAAAPPQGGYIVLLPEVPPSPFATGATNELLNQEQVPASFKISPQKCRDAVGILSLNHESKVWRIDASINADANFPVTLELIKELDTSDIDYAVSVLNIVHILENLPHYDDLIKRANKARNLKFESKPIYYACRELLADNPRNSILQHHVRLGKLNGIELSPASQTLLYKLSNEVQETKMKFKNNVADANAKFRHLIVDEKHLGDMNIHEKTAIAKDRANPEKGPWTVTLAKQVYTSFLENSPVAGLRWNIWQAYNQRCADKKQNSIHIEEIRSNRKDTAKLLGYRNYTELALQSKLAANAHNVKSMIATLLVKCMPQQKIEIDRLHKFALSKGYDDPKLNPWDIPYWRKRENEHLYNLQNLTFSYTKAFKNLLTFTSQIFGVEYKEVSENRYTVHRTGSSEIIGRFIIDPYKTKTKFPGTYVLRNNLFSTLILNFDPPHHGQETKLSPTELNVLFENFGHLLQNCLNFNTKATGESEPMPIIQDFKIPGPFLALWLGNKQFVQTFLEIDGDQLENYLLSRQHFGATDLCHELYLSDLDLELDLSEDFWLDVVKKLWGTYNLLALDKNHSLCSSNLIHYGSTYYSDVWSKMLAADCYRAFVDRKVTQDWAVEGKRFCSSFFETGVSSQPSEIFRLFRGRDPSPDAFLWSMGLKRLAKIDE